MPRLDETRPFLPVNIALLTVSDTRDAAQDRSGNTLADLAVPGLDQPVPTLPMFHPSFLLRTPERKREAWRDLLSLRARLDELLAAAPSSG